MNKTKTLSSLYNIANVLDNSGLYKEANTITQVMVRIAEEDNSKVDKAIERFKRSCEAISNSKRTKQEKRTERMLKRYEISQNLSGEDLEKFDKAANNIFVD